MKTNKTNNRSRTIEYLRGKLLEKREKLLRQMNKGVGESIESNRGPADEADMANSEIAMDTGYEVGYVESKEVAEIDNALRRIEKGNYGICEDCNVKIPAARLKALPFAYLCVACKEKEERENAIVDPFAFQWDAYTELQGAGEEEEDSGEHAVYKGNKAFQD